MDTRHPSPDGPALSWGKGCLGLGATYSGESEKLVCRVISEQRFYLSWKCVNYAHGFPRSDSGALGLKMASALSSNTCLKLLIAQPFILNFQYFLLFMYLYDFFLILKETHIFTYILENAGIIKKKTEVSGTRSSVPPLGPSPSTWAARSCPCVHNTRLRQSFIHPFLDCFFPCFRRA